MLRVTNINFMYDDTNISGVHVSFEGSSHDADGNLSLNGYVSLTMQEYIANIQPQDMLSVVRERVSARAYSVLG